MSGSSLRSRELPDSTPHASSHGLVVHKFGGTSLETAERIKSVSGLIGLGSGHPVVVVSAMAGVTARLAALARNDAGARGVAEALAEIRARHLMAASTLGEVGGPSLATRVDEILDGARAWLERTDADDPLAREDAILAAGEDLSAELVTRALLADGVNAALLDARLLIRTDERFGRAIPDLDETDLMVRAGALPLIAEGRVPVIQGFIGSTADGRTTTLGRGGSDFTATLVAAPLSADEVVIWTDVSGIHTADPREVEGARAIREIGFEEAVELAYFGAGVVHVSAAKHAVFSNLPLRIRDSGAHEKAGTLVNPGRRGGAEFAAVAFKPAVLLVRVRAFPSAMAHGFLARVFAVLGAHQVPVDLVATSHSSTAFTIDRDEDLTSLRDELSRFAEVEITPNLATITVVGHGLLSEPGMEALAFLAVGKTQVHLISQASDVSLSFVVSEEDAAETVRRLHLSLIELRSDT
ncbi:MAG: lysine-sensitive aspartokinase 3 [Gemmatimonadota bacterium]|nr:MAG: lysine-sensitive aspartokinase 3 [Gemmatimonadota bacterium]